ncbi:chloride channel protein [Perlabentimonas gracilis]|jgi:CIC family chloride channel protein|uniref:chloride channel protein n=1 Tax=Perlabentimonas gracilis TaxID=2715279 RepID=UPI00140BBA00|nr:chloride channel protein [Perlabentimonas gracilis]NHB68743.1 chloride channel protein [Perlabentimonas gracilis]
MKAKIQDTLNSWLHALQRLGQQRLILILSVVVGILSGLAAVILKNTVYLTRDLIQRIMEQGTLGFLYLALPGIGIIITVLYIKYFVKDDIGHGVSRILYSISKKGSKLKRHNTYTSIVSSTVTIGFGGSVGAEAPIVLTGAAIGSNIGQLFKLNYKTITLMLGCGAAAAIASIFKAPLAGLVFTLEVLMLDLTMASIVPLLIAAVTATTISYFLLGREVTFAFEIIEPFALYKIPFFILLGIFCGLISYYFTKTAMQFEGRFTSITNPYKRVLVGALVLGLLIFLFPPLYGEGFNTLQSLLDGEPSAILNNSLLYPLRDNVWIVLASLALLLVFKVFAMAATTGAGGVGGIFAPTLFMGGVAGYFMAKLLNNTVGTSLNEGNFTLVGMAGMMAGVMHAPLTAIFLIAELTGGYALFIPLMITSTIAYITIMYFEPHSIYTKRLAARGELITHHKDKAVLTLLRLGNVVEKDFSVVHSTDSLGKLVRTISQSRRNIFPVVDEVDELIGIVLLDDVRELMFDTDKYESTKVKELMTTPPEFIVIDEPMEKVMDKFETTGAWNLPVIDGDKKYVGFVSKSKIFSAYRNVLVQFSDE